MSLHDTAEPTNTFTNRIRRIERARPLLIATAVPIWLVAMLNEIVVPQDGLFWWIVGLGCIATVAFVATGIYASHLKVQERKVKVELERLISGLATSNSPPPRSNPRITRW